MLTKKLTVFLCCVFFLLTTILFSYETHSGSVSGTWSAGTHYLSASASVASGTTLTIEAGAVVKFAPNAYINVVGTLDVNGSSPSNVVITAKDDDTYGETISGSDGVPTAGDWQGINIDGGYGYFDYCRVRYGGKSTGLIGNIRFSDANDASYVSNCQIEYSGYYGICVYSCSPTISNSTISNNSGHGLYAYSSDSSPAITNNTFSNNSGYGVYLGNSAGSDGIALISYSGNTGTGNSTNGFGLKGTVSANCSWSSGSSSFPFILLGLTQINSGYTLTINAGTVIKGNSCSYIKANGTLDVNGESGSLVTFTSINDDNYGGDTKGDGTATSPSGGDWDGIYLDGSSYEGIGYFDYCRVRYGGRTSGNTNNANVYYYKSDAGHFTNSTSEYSQNYGLYVNNCNPEISYSTASNNGSNGAYVTEATDISITNNTFASNGADGLYLTSNTIAAIDNNTFNSNSGYGAYLNNLYLYSYTGNTGSDNTNNGFGIYGGNLWENANNTWTSGSETFPFIIVGGGTEAAKTLIEQHLTIGANTTLKFAGSGYCYMSDNNTNGYVSWSSGSAIWLAGSASPAPVGYDGGVLRFSTYRYWPSEWILETYSPGVCFTGGTYVTINNASGVILSADVTITSELTMTQGNITTDSYTLTIGSSASSTGSLSRTSGTVIGNLKRWFAASTTSDVLFPVGTATYYRPANVSFTSAPTSGGTLLANFTASNPGSTGLPVTDDAYEITKVASDGYWTVTSGGGLSGGTYSLDLTATSFSGISDYTDLHILKRADAGSGWSVSGSHSVGTGSNSIPIVHRTGLTSFSQFGIGSNESDNSLPVELTAFTADCLSGVVVLKWMTGSETENLGFIIQRKTVGANHDLPAEWSQIASYVDT
ncbi:MAG: right-handed parallel beta-helix repeat-containing protein, partial [Candidatus Neomarinimicrobiota bacterium]